MDLEPLARISAICKLPVVPICRSRAILKFRQIGIIFPCIPPRQEGRIAIVTTREAGCGGREGA
jgi:hypothetical protein